MSPALDPLHAAVRALGNAEDAIQAALDRPDLPPLVRTQLLALVSEVSRTAGVAEALLEGFVALPPPTDHPNLRPWTRTGA